MGKSFGKSEDGPYTICRAKPENRGLGRCKHSEHVELSESDLRSGKLAELNEKVYEELYEQKAAKRALDGDGSIVSASGSRVVLSKEEFSEAVTAASNQFSSRDFSIIKEFYAEYDRVLSDRERKLLFQEDDSSNIENFLRSENPVAAKLRDYLGPEIDLRDFSEIIVQGVGSMTSAVQWSPRSRRVSVARSILTALNNDMTKERYIASVLYFGGRCCYCNNPMSKNSEDGNSFATGEHITPISPKSPKGIRGGTRYGNMALACSRCNKSRANEELSTWIRVTSSIPTEKKGATLVKIKAFRDFALYRDYTADETEIINEKISQVEKKFRSLKDRAGDYLVPLEEAKETMRREVKIAVYDLQHGLSND